MVRVVFDTVIFVRSLLNPGSIWGRIVFGHATTYRLVVSPVIQAEIVEVLHRREVIAKFRFVAGMDRDAVLRRLAAAERVDVSEIPAVSRDVKDDTFLATAKAARADYRVSEDDDLLMLGEYEGSASSMGGRCLPSWRAMARRDELARWSSYSG